MQLIFNSNQIHSTRSFLYQYNSKYFRIVKVKNCRNPGFELIGEFKDRHLVSSDEVQRISLSRTKRNIRELALCNNFEYFVTLTVNKNYCDRYDLDICEDNLKKLFKKYKRKNPNFLYLFIAEKHKDGAFHFHGLVRGMDADDFYINPNNYLSSHFFDELGFNSFSVIKNYEKTCNYITKYITKDCCKNKHNQIYISSKGLKKASKSEILNLPDNFFNYHNDFCAIRDINISLMNSKQIIGLVSQIIDKNVDI